MRTSFQNLFETIDYLLISVEKIHNLVSKVDLIKPPPKNISFEEAIIYLKSEGLIISKSKLYKLTSSKSIPFVRFGNRLVFNSDELSVWAHSKILAHKDNGINSVVKSAIKKINSTYKNAKY